MKDKVFNPSYDVASQTAYNKRFKRCDALRGVETSEAMAEYAELDCKRPLHKMIHGGRQHLRGVKGDKVPLGVYPGTRKRLKDNEPVWRKRTQSPKSKRKSLLVNRIRDSITAYREDSPYEDVGFLVPDTVYPLYEIGMQKKAAWILVDRAAGRFYPADMVVTEGLRQFSLLDRVERQIGHRLKYGGVDGSQLMASGSKWGPVEFIALRGEGLESVYEKNDIQTAHETWVAEVKKSGKYYGDKDNPRLIKRMFDHFSTAVAASAAKNPQLIISFEDRKSPFVIPILDMQHFDKLSTSDSFTAIEYKTLGVPLSRLPALVASLSKRKRKEKRRSNTRNRDFLTALENPMPTDEWYYFEQYSKSPYGAQKPIPAARRNAGKKKATKRKSTARRNTGSSDVLATKNGQPYIILPNGKARFITKSKAAKLNGLALTNGRGRGTKKGQFSTSSRKSLGYQPSNRRNPRKARNNPASDAMQIHHNEGITLKAAWKRVKAGRY